MFPSLLQIHACASVYCLRSYKNNLITFGEYIFFAHRELRAVCSRISNRLLIYFLFQYIMNILCSYHISYLSFLSAPDASAPATSGVVASISEPDGASFALECSVPCHLTVLLCIVRLWNRLNHACLFMFPDNLACCVSKFFPACMLPYFSAF